jgi:hypothetical protein
MLRPAIKPVRSTRRKRLSSMHIRTRKFIGALALLALVTLWALLAMVLAQAMLGSANHMIAGLFYALAGLGWVLPAMPLVAWMSRPDA